MSRIDELIKQYCPDGVEFKTLGELLETIPRGKRLTKSNLAQDGSIPVFHGGLDPIGFHDEANTPGMTVMVINTGASSGTVGWSDVPFWCSDGCFALPHSDAVSSRYLYYCAILNQHHFVDKVRKAGIPTLAAGSILSLKIPVPPIEVQREIVDILDKFTQLEAELEAELETRRKQYEYYRNELLSFKNVEGGVRWVSMSEVFDYANTRLANSDDANISYVGVENLAKNRCGLDSIGELPLSGSAIRFEPGDVLVGNIRPYLKKIWLADCEGGTNGDVLTFRIKPRYLDKVDSRFAYQWLSSDEFFDYAVKTSKGAKMPRGDKEAILKYRFPLVPRAIQDEVLLTLESFQKITSDLNSGLPAEIEARRKQYEFYRDRLLSFKELDVA